jgi:KDO2-lipid IV(A) lauroyltransferase
MLLGKAVRRCIGLLKENTIIGLAGDRDFTEKGLLIDFFGKPAIFPEGPANFSLKIGSIILPTFALRNPDDSFTFRFEEPVEFVPTGDKVKDTLALITKYKAVFEDYIRKYPDQWYIFRRFWKE